MNPLELQPTFTALTSTASSGSATATDTEGYVEVRAATRLAVSPTLSDPSHDRLRVRRLTADRPVFSPPRGTGDPATRIIEETDVHHRRHCCRRGPGTEAQPVQRAIGVLNAAARANMLDRGVPETDADKIIEAERIVELARQAWAVAQQIGPGNVPNYQQIVDVLWPRPRSSWASARLLGQRARLLSRRPSAVARASAWQRVFCGAEDPRSRDGVTCDLPPESRRPSPQGYGQSWDNFLPPDARLIPPVPAQPELRSSSRGCRGQCHGSPVPTDVRDWNACRKAPRVVTRLPRPIPPGCPSSLPHSSLLPPPPTPPVAVARLAVGDRAPARRARLWADAERWRSGLSCAAMVARTSRSSHWPRTGEETIVPSGLPRPASGYGTGGVMRHHSRSLHLFRSLISHPASSSSDAGTPAASSLRRLQTSSSELLDRGRHLPSSAIVGLDVRHRSSGHPRLSRRPAAPAEDTENDPQYAELVEQVEQRLRAE
jgi:hypothetical protein